jgi:hypothetical protein
MSQNVRNEPGGNQGDSGRVANERSERNRYEGFEGMNYEQVRQPYHPQRGGSKDMNGPDSGEDNSKRRDEI